MKAAQFLVVGVPLLWLFITSFLITGFGIPGIQEKPWVVKWRSMWRLGIAWLNLLIMWAILGYFAVLRRRIIQTAGGLDNQTTWSFGQILALATWAPIVFEFVYIFICECFCQVAICAQRSMLTKRVIRGYRRELRHAFACGLQDFAKRQARRYRL